MKNRKQARTTEEFIAAVEAALHVIYFKAKEGSLTLSTVQRSFSLPGHFPTALKTLGILSREGERHQPQWKWTTKETPSAKLAESVVIEIRKLVDDYQSRPSNENQKEAESKPADPIHQLLVRQNNLLTEIRDYLADQAKSHKSWADFKRTAIVK